MPTLTGANSISDVATAAIIANHHEIGGRWTLVYLGNGRPSRKTRNAVLFGILVTEPIDSAGNYKGWILVDGYTGREVAIYVSDGWIHGPVSATKEYAQGGGSPHFVDIEGDGLHEIVAVERDQQGYDHFRAWRLD